MFQIRLTLLSLSVLVLSQNVISQIDQAPKVNVAVYYESLCPDSIRFFNRQLYPTYKKIKDVLNIVLIPYGKAIQNKNSQGQWVFDCQHGPAECYGNKVQACVINQTLPSDVMMQILNCMMSNANPSTAGRKCAARSEVAYEPIEQCANGPLGDELLAYYGDLTHAVNPKISFVPTIIFNGVYDYKLQNRALRNLLATVCEQIPVDLRPAECSEST